MDNVMHCYYTPSYSEIDPAKAAHTPKFFQLDILTSTCLSVFERLQICVRSVGRDLTGSMLLK